MACHRKVPIYLFANKWELGDKQGLLKKARDWVCGNTSCFSLGFVVSDVFCCVARLVSAAQVERGWFVSCPGQIDNSVGAWFDFSVL